MPTFYVLSKNKKNITFFHLKIANFTAVKNRNILHRRVFVMNLNIKQQLYTYIHVTHLAGGKEKPFNIILLTNTQ